MGYLKRVNATASEVLEGMTIASDPVKKAWEILAMGAPKRPDYDRWVRQFDAHKGRQTKREKR